MSLCLSDTEENNYTIIRASEWYVEEQLRQNQFFATHLDIPGEVQLVVSHNSTKGRKIVFEKNHESVRDLSPQGESKWSLRPEVLSFMIGSIRKQGLKHYLKRRNFRGKKISRISRILTKVAEINSFFDPRKCQFAKINSREIFQNWWFAKINSREIFQELMKCKYWSFCLIQSLLN